MLKVTENKQGVLQVFGWDQSCLGVRGVPQRCIWKENVGEELVVARGNTAGKGEDKNGSQPGGHNPVWGVASDILSIRYSNYDQ